MRKNQNPTISVILPVYNNEDFICKCIKSVLAQTFSDFELIIIDDGSTDETPKILKIFEEQDSRIRVIKQRNKGVSAARNKGLDEARGTYIMFVDADDYIEPTTLEDACNYITKHDSDICVFSYRRISYKEDIQEIQLSPHVLIFDDYFENVPKDFFLRMTSVWGKLFRNNDLLPRFNENLNKLEDAAFIWEYYLKNPKISVLNGIYYSYIDHQNCAVSNPKLAEDLDAIRSFNYVKSLPNFKKLPPITKAYIIDRYALSFVREIKRIYQNQKWPEFYRKAIGSFLIENYASNVASLENYAKLRDLYLKQTFPLLSKIYQSRIEDNYRITQIFGLTFKKQILLEDITKAYIKKLQKNMPKYKQDTYLLADCLDGDISECNNTYPLFLYMREKGLNAYYVLLMQNPLYNKLAKEDKLDHIIALPNNVYSICFFSWLYDTLLHTKAIIVSHALFFEQYPFLVNNPYLKYIYIQHGQTYLKEHILPNGYLAPQKYNYAVIPSEFESRVFKKYGWCEEQFIKTPLPRWDFLPQKSAKNKKILIMFTWRHMEKESFNGSLYRQRILKLLNDEEFENYLKSQKIELYFALHHSLLGYAKVDFNTGYKNVVPVDEISKYIKECSLLITDFSSVAFDFMFQNKPVLFYLIDHDDANMDVWDRMDMDTMEYKKYFVHNVFLSWEKTFEKLQEYVINNFELEKEIKEDYDKFFYFKKDIRKRLTEEIEKICPEKEG